MKDLGSEQAITWNNMLVVSKAKDSAVRDLIL
jgi:hypothetical protein